MFRIFRAQTCRTSSAAFPSAAEAAEEPDTARVPVLLPAPGGAAVACRLALGVVRHDCCCVPWAEDAETIREACLLWGMRPWPGRIASNMTSGASEDLADLSTGIA